MLREWGKNQVDMHLNDIVTMLDLGPFSKILCAVFYGPETYKIEGK